MKKIHFAHFIAAVATGAMLSLTSPAVATTLTVSGERTLSSPELQPVEWQGGKPANSNPDWDKGGGYGGKQEKQDNGNGDSESSGWKSGKSAKDCKQTGSCKGDHDSSESGSSNGGNTGNTGKTGNAGNTGNTGNTGKKEGGAPKSTSSGDACSDKFVPGSAAWKACKGIPSSGSGSVKKPENAFLTPAQCAAKFPKGSREYVKCIM